MMATTAEYAKWIVDNKDKKGTPEFDKVSQAYQLSKAMNGASFGEGSVPADIVRSLGSGAADILGAPVDIVSAGLRAAGADISPVQAGGSENLRDLGAKVGLTFRKGEEPQDFISRLFREAGSTAVPLGGVLGRGAKLAEREATNAFDRLAKEAAKKPAATIAFEGASAAGAATGGAVAQQYTDNPAIVALSELAGGLGPSAVGAMPKAAVAAAKAMPVTGAAMKGLSAATMPFTRAGGKVIASRRLQGLSEDPARAAQRLVGGDIIEGVDLSPARRIGESRLLSLEQAILKQNPDLDAKFSENLGLANDKTRAEAQEFLGDPKRARKLLEQRRDHLLSLVETRAAQAAREAQDAIARLGPDATERQISIAAREKVSAAYADARKTERELWNAVDREAPASLDTGRETLAAIMKGRSMASDPEDIPDYVVKLLANPKDVNVGYVADLRSRLIDDAAAARAAGKFNKARILSQIANGSPDGKIKGLLQSIENTSESSRTAAAFSRTLNDKFTRGSVGDLLGTATDRGLKVDPSETLEFMNAGKDIGRANRLTELMKAAPDAAPEVEKYLSAAFVRQATDGGVVNVPAAKRFIQKYGESIGQFPNLQSQIGDALKKSTRATSAQARAQSIAKGLGNNRMSRASLYLDGTVGEEWRRVLNSDDPVGESRALLSQLRRDPDAVQGFKQGFVDEIMRRAETSDVDASGQIVVSGKRFRRALAEHKSVADALLTAPERGRLERIANTFARIDAKPGDEVKILDDAASQAVDFIASYIGAHAAALSAAKGPGSLVIAGRGAGFFRRLANGMTTNKARSLIVGAVDDPELYRSLLVGPTDTPGKQAAALRKINAWMAVPLTPNDQPNEQRR